MTKKIILYGASQYGGEVADHIHDINMSNSEPEWEIVGFLDDNPNMLRKDRNGIPVLGNKTWLNSNDLSLYHFICCIGNPVVKRNIISMLDEKKVRYATLIHPSVIKSTTSQVAEGCIIMAGNVLSTLSIIEPHAIVNMACTVAHNAVVGKYSNVNPGARISGNVILEEGIFIGSNAVIFENLRIGRYSKISALSMVYSNIPEASIIMGVPGRIIDKNTFV